MATLWRSALALLALVLAPFLGVALLLRPALPPAKAAQLSFAIELDQHRGKFEQGIGLAVEAPGFHVDDDGQETAEAVDH